MNMKRIILLIVLALEGLGGMLGGVLLAIAPDGHLMKIPVDGMHGAFPDFFIPGILLTGMGVLTSVAFITVLRRSNSDWFMAALALVGFTIWFAVEIAILRQVHWLHIVWGVPVLIGIWAALPLVHKGER